MIPAVELLPPGAEGCAIGARPRLCILRAGTGPAVRLW